MKNEKLINDLNTYLSNLHVLYTKVHNFHWNVNGQGFFTVHSKLEELYNHIADEIDEVAERIIVIGGTPFASLKDYLANATLTEVASVGITGTEAVKLILNDFENILDFLNGVHALASEANDVITVSLLEGSIANYQKSIWMYSAYLKK